VTTATAPARGQFADNEWLTKSTNARRKGREIRRTLIGRAIRRRIETPPGVLVF
jgi:hypothetical protein